jgi:thioredoxin reductase/NAD-dependent dihydropyrimidine dehydrogenase PreA subunit
MTTVVIVAVVLLVALGLERLWRMREQASSVEGARILEDVAALGDTTPDSLHPRIDPDRCIGSGACAQACPEKQIIGVVAGRAALLNPLACVGHGACAAACPVEAIQLVFGSSSRGVELPALDPTFQTSQPGVYVVGELGGMGLIRNAVAQGTQAVDAIAASHRRGSADLLDVIVVGAGPAGIATTLAAMRAGLRVELLEREAFGGTVAHYPRAKVVMTGTLELPLFGTVKRRTMTKEELVALFADVRRKTALPVRTGELVSALAHEGDAWSVTATSGTFRAANVVLALGRRGAPRKLGVPGEDELGKIHHRLLEPEVFAGRDMLVVGGGNAAVECALALAEQGRCKSVTISYRRSAFARCRAEVRQRIDEAIASGRVAARMPSEVVRVEKDHVVLTSEGREERLANDDVIVQIGGTSPAELLATFGVQMVTKRGEA